MTMLEVIASKNPGRPVRLHFRSIEGGAKFGTLDLTAREAVEANANRSGRFFPPAGKSAADLGWPVPYWYADECEGVELL